MLDICLLGTGGMMPLPNRWLTSLMVRYNGRLVLIDCGEGTQIPARMAGWGFKALDAILFTHFHADHIAGLPGLLLTIGNSGREEKLILAGPPGLQEVVKGLLVIAPELPYELQIVEFSDTQADGLLINDLDIRSLPVDHTITCLAYSMELKRQGRFDADRAKALDIPVKLWNRLQKGEVVTIEDRTVTPRMVLGEDRKGIKIGYCTDSRPTVGLADFVKDSDLLICEGMYGDANDQDKAIVKKHMMFEEAACVAKQGLVKELYLTHYSPSLTDPEEFIDAARAVFKETYAGTELMVKNLKFED